jgi:superfamily II DNA or RNA helicase
MTRLTLRPYQDEALARVDEAVRRGVRSLLGVAATGLGKTVIFCALAERIGGRTLILAHRDELVRQAAAKVREVWPEADVGIVQGNANDVRAKVVVASVQTIAREKRLAALANAWENESLYPVDPFSLVVIDEAHHAAADSYRSIIAALRAGDKGCRCGTPHDANGEVSPCPMTYPGPILFGVTATPDRGDGQGLDDLFEEIPFAYDILWGIRSGYLSDLRGMAVRLADFAASDLKVKRGDYDAGDAGRLLEAAGAPRLIVSAWQEHASDRPTVCFAPTVALARLIADEYRKQGVSAVMLSGETPISDRRQLLDDFARGNIRVVVNCGVLTEGFDEPSVSCIVVARPTRSRALYAQMVGRGTRRHPEKTDCLVLDVVGVSDDLSLVTVPTLFGLTGDRAEAGRNRTVGVAALADDEEREQLRLGLLRAEEVQLFQAIRAEGIAWVALHAEGEPKRFSRNLGDGQPTVILAESRSGGWVAGLLHPDGSKRVLINGVPMETAQGVAEDYVRRAGGVLARADAKWRALPPTAKQIAAAKRWRVTVEPGMTRGDLSDAIDRKAQRVKGLHRRAAS